MSLNIDFSRPVNSAFLQRTRLFSEETHQLIDTCIPFLNAYPESRKVLAIACLIVHLSDLGSECFEFFYWKKDWDLLKLEMGKTALTICRLTLTIRYPYLDLITFETLKLLKLVGNGSIESHHRVQHLSSIMVQACYLVSLITESPTFQALLEVISLGKGNSGLPPETEEKIFQKAPFLLHMANLSQGFKIPILCSNIFKLWDTKRPRSWNSDLLSLCYATQTVLSGFALIHIMLHPLTNTKGINGQHDPSYNVAMIKDIFSRCVKKDFLHESSDLFGQGQSLGEKILPVLLHGILPFLVNLLVIHRYWREWASRKYHIGATGDRIDINDVIGCESAKKSILKIVDQLKNPQQYTRIGPIKTVKGILFFGPPGTGKTMLAKALAYFADNAHFLEQPGSAFIDKLVGQGPSNIRTLFADAQSLAMRDKNRLVVIYIDEINAIAAKRSSGENTGSAREHNSTTEAFLTAIDSSLPNVVVIGATNVEPNLLDEAFVRPGRFDEHVEFKLPTREERKAILDKLRLKYQIDPTIKGAFWEEIARLSEHWSYVDLTNFVEQAASEAGYQKLSYITKSILDETLEKLKKRKSGGSSSSLSMYS